MTNADAERVSDIVAVDRAIEELCMLGENAFLDDPKRSFGAIAEAVYLLRNPPAADIIEAQSKALAETREAPANFDDWWSKDGAYIDPDTDDVPWFDKRRGLAQAAYDAGAATAGRPWPDFIAPAKNDDAAPGWTDPALPDFRLIWRVAKASGYAIGLHGSMKRDCDMIAVPWVEAHATPQSLIDRLCMALNAREIGPREPKANGRIAVNLQIDGWFKLIDLSIVPALTPTPENPNG